MCGACIIFYESRGTGEIGIRSAGQHATHLAATAKYDLGTEAVEPVAGVDSVPVVHGLGGRWG